MAEGMPVVPGQAPPGSLAGQDQMAGLPVVPAQPVGAPETDEMER